MATPKFWRKIHDRLYTVYGDCVCPLKHETPFQLMAAVMLSAQCRDDRVNAVTENLFAVAPDAAAMAGLPVEKIEMIIHPCGLSQNKSRHLKAAAEMIVREFNGQLPSALDKLVRLPGIGRKSANVLLGNAFSTPGFPVDTHVKRLLNRIGVVESDDPEVIERENNRKVPPELWTNFSHLLIRHGREVCHARKPECDECMLSDLCKFHNRHKSSSSLKNS